MAQNNKALTKSTCTLKYLSVGTPIGWNYKTCNNEFICQI